MYRVMWSEGNDYHCSCCREVRDMTEDFETVEKLMDWLIEFEWYNKINKPDRYLCEINEISEDLTEKIQSDPYFINGIAERERAKEEANKVELERKRKAKVRRENTKANNEKKKLKQLAEKYPELLKEKK